MATVRARSSALGARFEGVLEEMTHSTTTLRELLCRNDWNGSYNEEVAGCIRSFQANLEVLGVVPPEVCELVRRIEEAGGAAKVSGAGGNERAWGGQRVGLSCGPRSTDQRRRARPPIHCWRIGSVPTDSGKTT